VSGIGVEMMMKQKNRSESDGNTASIIALFVAMDSKPKAKA